MNWWYKEFNWTAYQSWVVTFKLGYSLIYFKLVVITESCLDAKKHVRKKKSLSHNSSLYALSFISKFVIAYAESKCNINNNGFYRACDLF